MHRNVEAPAGYDRSVRRKAVNLSLNTDLVTRAKGLTRNLSGTVEYLLTGFVEQEEARQRASDERLDAVISALDAFHEQHGLLSDDFPSL
nr:type II toxin-antitoxin system CcdA family antitoxin [uncultured Rhodopila sp.]